MMSKHQFRLVSDYVRNNAKVMIDSLPLPEKDEDGNFLQRPMIIEIKPETRTLEQNAKLHAMLTDIANQCEFQGKKRDVETWKAIFVSAHKIATGGQAEMAIGLEGEVINLRGEYSSNGCKTFGEPNRIHYLLGCRERRPL